MLTDNGRGDFGVYPRVGGGNLVPPLVHVVGLGLSPRGRGKHTVIP